MKKKIIVKGKLPFAGRVYREQDGNYASVTSIIHPEGLDFPPELLKQYASRGTIVHRLTEEFLTTGQVLSPEDIDLPEDLSIVMNGSLKLKIGLCNFKGFFDEFGKDIDVKYIEQKLKNRKHGYMGRADIVGKYKGEWAIFDVKTSGKYDPEKLKDYWMQLSAYANCITPVPKKLVIIPLNPNMPKGYMEPLVEEDVEHYFNLFLKQLEHVKEKYIMPV